MKRHDLSPDPLNQPPEFKVAVVLGIVGILILMFMITILTIKTSMPILETPDTPYGYTWSNLHWGLPSLAVFGLFFLLNRAPSDRKSVFWTIVILPLTGFGLDIFFADRFFTFKNTGAIIGWFIYGFSFETMSFSAPIPIEEFIFYIAGFVYTLAAYVFAKDIWLSKYTVRYDAREPIARYPLLWVSAAIFALTALGFGLKALFGVPGSSLIPEYYLFILYFGSVPFIALLPIVYRIVNWEAFSWVMLSVLLISVIWEVTMAIPYGWWGYHKEVMVGVFIKPWFDLPLEAVTVWITVSFTTISTYEAIGLYCAKSSLGLFKKQL